MTTVIPQSELTKRAIAWINEHCPPASNAAELNLQIEAAAVRFNLGPLDVEFLERFYANGVVGEKQP